MKEPMEKMWIYASFKHLKGSVFLKQQGGNRTVQSLISAFLL